MKYLALLLIGATYLLRWNSIGSFFLTDNSFRDMVTLANPDLFQRILLAVPETYRLLIVVSFITSFFSVMLLGKILEHYKFRRKLITIVQLVMIFSPHFISTYTLSVRLGLNLFLLMLAFYLFVRKKEWLGAVILGVFSLMGIHNLLLALLLMIILRVVEKKKLSWIFLYLGIFAVFYLPVYLKGLPVFGQPFPYNPARELFSDFGGDYGIGIFKFLLAFLGLLLVWKENIRVYMASLVSLLLLVFSLFTGMFNYILLPFTSFFAGYAIYYYYSRKWKIDFLQVLTIIIFVCGLLFSFISYNVRQYEFLPDTGFIEAMGFLDTLGAGVVLSHYENGNAIDYYTGMKPLLYTRDIYYADLTEAYKRSNEIFYSRNIVNTESMLAEHDINYIFITPKMKSGQVFTKEGQGILFLFRNKEIFTQLYSKDGYEIWKVNVD